MGVSKLSAKVFLKVNYSRVFILKYVCAIVLSQAHQKCLL